MESQRSRYMCIVYHRTVNNSALLLLVSFSQTHIVQELQSLFVFCSTFYCLFSALPPWLMIATTFKSRIICKLLFSSCIGIYIKLQYERGRQTQKGGQRPDWKGIL